MRRVFSRISTVSESGNRATNKPCFVLFVMNAGRGVHSSCMRRVTVSAEGDYESATLGPVSGQLLAAARVGSVSLSLLGHVSCLAVLPLGAGRLPLACTFDGSECTLAVSIFGDGAPVQTWDLARAGGPNGCGTAVAGSVPSTALAFGTTCIAAAGQDGTVRVHDLRASSIAATIPNASSVRALLWVRLHSLLAIGSATGLLLYDAIAGRSHACNNEAPVRSLALANEETIVAGGDDGILRLWSSTHQPLALLASSPRTLASSPVACVLAPAKPVASERAAFLAISTAGVISAYSDALERSSTLEEVGMAQLPLRSGVRPLCAWAGRNVRAVKGDTGASSTPLQAIVAAAEPGASSLSVIAVDVAALPARGRARVPLRAVRLEDDDDDSQRRCKEPGQPSARTAASAPAAAPLPAPVPASVCAPAPAAPLACSPTAPVLPLSDVSPLPRLVPAHRTAPLGLDPALFVASGGGGGSGYGVARVAPLPLLTATLRAATRSLTPDDGPAATSEAASPHASAAAAACMSGHAAAHAAMSARLTTVAAAASRWRAGDVLGTLTALATGDSASAAAVLRAAARTLPPALTLTSAEALARLSPRLPAGAAAAAAARAAWEPFAPFLRDAAPARASAGSLAAEDRATKAAALLRALDDACGCLRTNADTDAIAFVESYDAWRVGVRSLDAVSTPRHSAAARG